MELENLNPTYPEQKKFYTYKKILIFILLAFLLFTVGLISMIMLLQKNNVKTESKRSSFTFEEKIINVGLLYNRKNNPKLSIKNISSKYTTLDPSAILNSSWSSTTTGDNYLLQIVDENNTIIATKKISINGEIASDEFSFEKGYTGSRLIKLDNLTTIQTLPSYKEATKVLLKNENGTLIQSTYYKSTPQNNQHVLGASSGSTDIVFIPYDFQESEMTEFRRLVTADIATLKTVEPWSSAGSLVNYHINDSPIPSLICSQYPRVDSYCLDCNWDAAESAIKQTGVAYDHIVILGNEKTKTGACSPGTNVTLPSSLVSTGALTHELGHAVGNLLHEDFQDIPGEITNTADKNCYMGPPPASAWQNIVPNDSYFKGCMRNNWYRSSNQSIMGSDVMSYSRVALWIMREKLGLPNTPISNAPAPSGEGFCTNDQRGNAVAVPLGKTFTSCSIDSDGIARGNVQWNEKTPDPWCNKQYNGVRDYFYKCNESSNPGGTTATPTTKPPTTGTTTAPTRTPTPTPTPVPCAGACAKLTDHSENDTGTSCPSPKTWHKFSDEDGGAWCNAQPNNGGKNTCWVCKNLTNLLDEDSKVCKENGGVKADKPLIPKCGTGTEGIYDMAAAYKGDFCNKQYTDEYQCAGGSTDPRHYESYDKADPRTPNKPYSTPDNPCNGPIWCPNRNSTPGSATVTPPPNASQYCPPRTSSCLVAACATGRRAYPEPTAAANADLGCRGINPFTGQSYGNYCCLNPDTTPGAATTTPTPAGNQGEHAHCYNGGCAPQYKCNGNPSLASSECVYKNPSEPGAYCSLENDLHCEKGSTTTCNTGTPTGLLAGDLYACQRAGMDICCSTKPAPTPTKLGSGQTCAVGGMPCEDWLECKPTTTNTGATGPGMCVNKPGVAPPTPTINPGGKCTNTDREDLGCACNGTGSSGCGILSPYACMMPGNGATKSACCGSGQRACDDGTCTDYAHGFSCGSNSSGGNPTPIPPTATPVPAVNTPIPTSAPNPAASCAASYFVTHDNCEAWCKTDAGGNHKGCNPNCVGCHD